MSDMDVLLFIIGFVIFVSVTLFAMVVFTILVIFYAWKKFDGDLGKIFWWLWDKGAFWP